MLRVCFKYASNILQVCFKHASSMLQACFKYASSIQAFKWIQTFLILLSGSSFWKFSKISKGIFQFVVSTCPYMFTWPKISGYAQKLAAVCVFYLILLAYLAKHLRTRTHNQCSLWFVLVDTCLLACLAPNFGTCTKFQCSLWFLTLPYLLTCPRNPKISGFVRKISVVCVFLHFITWLLAPEFQDMRKIWICFVFSTWSYLLT